MSSPVAGAVKGGVQREPDCLADDGIGTASERLPSEGYTVPARKAWLLACQTRLCQLRPTADPRALARLAAELWREAGSFDPAVAAEMEVESGSAEDGDG